ncbi:hypothetical protein M885DRAFT_241302 [Pelagophyceae sp. CCMP2097]|nr:hypothetical protein M885DRAFT_241302 [Pelagophyceae sp. CCMP2097]
MPRRRAALLGWLLSPLSSGFLAPPAAGHGARGRRASATKAELEVAQAAVDAAVEAAVEADARGAAADLAAVVLTPGAVVVRVDKAPSNSRRIFTGVDVAADIEIVWNLLTDYANLAAVVPNLVANEVLNPPRRHGARLRQVGSAQVLPGLNFRASMILDVDELRGGLPAKRIRGGAAALEREDAALRDAEKELPLKRGMFPRPWSTRASETTHDITMVSVAGEPGDFTLYQGLWRMEAVPLPGHAAATRLTFSVEIQPRPWLPVALVESRIADDLVKNLAAVAAEAKRRSDAENCGRSSRWSGRGRT